MRRTAARFAGNGVDRGEVIGVALGDTIEHLVSIYALAALGAIVLPMDCRWTQGGEGARGRAFPARRVSFSSRTRPGTLRFTAALR